MHEGMSLFRAPESRKSKTKPAERTFGEGHLNDSQKGMPPAFPRREITEYFEQAHHNRMPADVMQREQILLEDLDHAYASEANEKEKDRIRRIIWANSRELNKEPDEHVPTLALVEHIGDLRKSLADFAVLPDDTETVEERIEALRDALDAIEYDVEGEDVRETMRTIEGEYRAIFQQVMRNISPPNELVYMRAARDEFYERLLFPLFRELKRRAHHASKRPIHPTRLSAA